MKMFERFENNERTMNVLGTVTERTVSERWTLWERWTRANAERKTVNGERTMNGRWTHAERTVNARWANDDAKIGKKNVSGILLFEVHHVSYNILIYFYELYRNRYIPCSLSYIYLHYLSCSSCLVHSFSLIVHSPIFRRKGKVTFIIITKIKK